MSQSPTTTQNGLDTYAETTIQCAVSRLINKFGFPEQDREDLMQDLWVVVLEALPSYDPARAKRSTFIADCVENRVFNLLRDRRRLRRDPRRLVNITDDPASPGETTKVAAASLSDGKAEGHLDRTGLRLDIAQVISELTPRQQEICALLGDHTPHEITKILGLSRRQVYGDVEVIRTAFAAAGLGPDHTGAGKEMDQTV
jgi:RNA polymerase sigma-70 factor (ECF subfamily)